MYAGGKLAAQAPLPVGGILSDQPVSVLGKQLGQVRKAMEDLGYDNNNVIMSMSTLCLPVSPRLKLNGFRAVRGEEPGESASDPNLF